MALVFGYLAGVCFPKEQNAEGNARAPRLTAQIRSVIRRANGVPLGVETAGGREVDMGNQT